jgi:hypothetical protein
LEQKEGEQGFSSRVWHLSPEKPVGQMQKKLGADTEEGLGERGGVGSRAWQLPPFWQSWASWQGSGNWHVSPRKPRAHLGEEEKGKLTSLASLPLLSHLSPLSSLVSFSSFTSCLLSSHSSLLPSPSL